MWKYSTHSPNSLTYNLRMDAASPLGHRYGYVTRTDPDDKQHRVYYKATCTCRVGKRQWRGQHWHLSPQLAEAAYGVHCDEMKQQGTLFSA